MFDPGLGHAKTEAIARDIVEILPDVQVSLGDGERGVAVGELDLLDRCATPVDQFPERAAEVVRTERECEARGLPRHDVIESLRGHGPGGKPRRPLVTARKNEPLGNSGRGGPVIDSGFGPD